MPNDKTTCFAEVTYLMEKSKDNSKEVDGWNEVSVAEK